MIGGDFEHNKIDALRAETQALKVAITQRDAELSRLYLTLATLLEEGTLLRNSLGAAYCQIKAAESQMIQYARIGQEARDKLKQIQEFLARQAPAIPGAEQFLG